MRLLLLFAAAVLANGCTTQDQGGLNPAGDAGGARLTSPLSGIEFVRIPAGRFIMGTPPGEQGREADERQRPVTISRSFGLGKYEVTREQWRAVMGTEPWAGKRLVIDGANLPAIYVTWPDAQAFVARLNALEKTTAYRLPTEAEWEYAARGGSTGPFPGADPLRLGWFADNSGRTRVDAAALWVEDHETRLKQILDNGSIYRPVGRAAPNPFGLYDMHGNVWEWVADWYGDYPAGAVTDPRGPATGTLRALRGGSWSLPLHFGRSGSRDRDPPEHIAPALGFRVARDLP